MFLWFWKNEGKSWSWDLMWSLLFIYLVREETVSFFSGQRWLTNVCTAVLIYTKQASHLNQSKVLLRFIEIPFAEIYLRKQWLILNLQKQSFNWLQLARWFVQAPCQIFNVFFLGLAILGPDDCSNLSWVNEILRVAITFARQFEAKKRVNYTVPAGDTVYTDHDTIFFEGVWLQTCFQVNTLERTFILSLRSTGRARYFKFVFHTGTLAHGPAELAGPGLFS